MKTIIKILVLAVFTLSLVQIFSAPAQAFRPALVTQTKCVNKPCTIVRTRSCYSTPGPNRTIVWVCGTWSKPHRVAR